MFDLTREIVLPSTLQKKYTAARILLHVVFSMVMLFVAYRILFPIIPLDFALDTPSSNKNTLVNPRINQDGGFPTKKIIPADAEFLFNANPAGQFSKANITFSLEKNAPTVENSIVKINKSYQAFFYPLGDPVGFPDATLLTTPDGAYYIVSNGLLHRFANTDIILELGYPKSAFIEISTAELGANKIGIDIESAGTYPDSTLFVINENYYQLKNQQLIPFISVPAYLSQFDPVAAIQKNSDFLSRYPVSEKYLGFADGTLVSSAESAYILSKSKSYPIKSAGTFLAMGFLWENIIPVSTDELGIYEKQKQFTNDDSHPDGTLFFDQNSKKHFIVEKGKKRPLANDAVKKAYPEQNSVLANSQDAEKETSCMLEKNMLSSNTYSCNVSLKDIKDIVGNDYQIKTAFPNNVTLNNINVTFSTPLTFESLKNSLSIIKTRLIKGY